MEKNEIGKIEFHFSCPDSLEPLGEKEMEEYPPRCLAPGYCLKEGHLEELPHPKGWVV